MSPDQFQEKFHHILAGVILDAATAGRHGSDLSIWLRKVMPRVDSILLQAYADARREFELPVAPIQNGKPIKQEAGRSAPSTPSEAGARSPKGAANG